MSRSELTVHDFGEKRLLREVVRPELSEVPGGLGAGDDAAVVPFPEGGRLVVSSDKIPEDLLALEFGLMTPAELGRYLVAVSVSDIAAMGARPLGVLLTLALRDDFLVEDLRELIAGAALAGKEWGAPLVGGDTGSASTTCLSSSAFGYLMGEGALTRGGARPYDTLAVTGPVGGFGAALAYFAAKRDGRAVELSPATVEALRQRLVRPTPHLDLGPQLLDSDWCTSCMDITDGLGQSIRELAEASGVGFEIDAESVPLHPLALEVSEALNVDPYALAFGMGLELELLVTVAPAGVEAAFDYGLIAFGRARSDATIAMHHGGSHPVPLPGKGWEHFAGDVRDFIARPL